MRLNCVPLCFHRALRFAVITVTKSIISYSFIAINVLSLMQLSTGCCWNAVMVWKLRLPIVLNWKEILCREDWGLKKKKRKRTCERKVSSYTLLRRLPWKNCSLFSLMFPDLPRWSFTSDFVELRDFRPRQLYLHREMSRNIGATSFLNLFS